MWYCADRVGRGTVSYQDSLGRGIVMAKYIITTEHRFEVETDDIRKVLDNYEFPVFDEGVIGEAEFLDGTDTYEEVIDA
jgi:hypothetical protein